MQAWSNRWCCWASTLHRPTQPIVAMMAMVPLVAMMTMVAITIAILTMVASCLPDVISTMLATGLSLCTIPAAQQVLRTGPVAGPLPLRLHTVATRNPAHSDEYHDYELPRAFMSVPLLR